MIETQFTTLEKDSHILRPRMITNRTIQHNSDRTDDISFILLSHNEENDQKWDLETLNAETELKIGIYVKNLAKQVLLKIFDYSQSQRSMVRVNGQRLESMVNG